MGLLQRLRSWWKDPRRRLLRQGRQELDQLFLKHPLRLRGTSLRPKHRSRTQVLEVEAAPLRIWFGILRHPRPYGFSQQFHEVLEVWRYEPAAGSLEREKGHNLSRERGEDGQPSSRGTGV